MAKKSNGGRKKLPAGETKVAVTFWIKQSIVKLYPNKLDMLNSTVIEQIKSA